MILEMLLLQLHFEGVFKDCFKNVILLYNGCNYEFYTDYSKWEISWQKSV